MKDWSISFAFIVVSFITGLSISFNLCSLLHDKSILFKSTKSALFVYIIGVLFAIIFTLLSCYGVYEFRCI